MERDRRVVITGIATLTPLGLTLEEDWQNLIAGKSGIRHVTSFDVSDQDVRIAGELKGFNAADHVTRRDLKRMPRFVHMAMAAARAALEDARLDPATEDRDRVGVEIGSAIGGWPEIEENTRKLVANGPKAINAALSIDSIINMASCNVAITYGATGFALAPTSACATGAHAIGDAALHIRRGIVDVVIAGAAETPVSPLMLATFGGIGGLSLCNDEPEKACKPFDRRRDGTVLSDGAAVLILESLEHALRRGAQIRAEIVGFGFSTDAYHHFAPDPEGGGQAKAIAQALYDAHIRPQEVQFINAHGTATQRNDSAETNAIKRVFGEHAYKIPVISEKSILGHPYGAASAIAAAHTARIIETGIIPPTINLEAPDPLCDLDYVPNQARKQRVDVAIVQAFGLGGQNIALVIKRYEP
ncbi:MAG: beta-ketoacyl-ACP synthase II [Chloroflexi bacterium]|nr:beta-ketoacyl-ACP synthase II [Chloroflexota bacterium]